MKTIINRIMVLINTIRYFKFKQGYYWIYYRIKNKVQNILYFKKCIYNSAVGKKLIIKKTIESGISWLGGNCFSFLNRSHCFDHNIDWNYIYYGKLWSYNLNYFQYLSQPGIKKEEGLRLINEFIAQVGRNKIGMEPYPTSLRIVNWIIFISKYGIRDKNVDSSLYAQTRMLNKNIEYHILGNHLFVNAKALVFAGIYFSGNIAEKWLKKGFYILAREIPEQILSDGGHFERSPMYHALILKDILDMTNLIKCNPDSIPARLNEFVPDWSDNIVKMRKWLWEMSHPDGEISLFNDAAFKIAPNAGQIEDYAIRLGNIIRKAETQINEYWKVCCLMPSGYIRVYGHNAVAFLDTAPIGPDYLPGHAHADTMSFELSIFGRRVIVDSGTSCYGISPERLQQRSTAAHNTVVIDGKDSSEVWSGFRVARRAKVQELKVDEQDGQVTIMCSHNGYTRLQGKPIHERQWMFRSGRLEIFDKVIGSVKLAEVRLHLHPEVQCEQITDTKAEVLLPGGQVVKIVFMHGKIILQNSSYHNEFGLSLENVCIVAPFINEQAMEIIWK